MDSRTAYRDYRKSEYWGRVSEAVKRRDGFRCRVCNSTFALQAHHRTYEHRGFEMAHLGDLTTLCGRCHAIFHEKSKLVAQPKTYTIKETLVEVTENRTVIVTHANCHLLRKVRSVRDAARGMGVDRCEGNWQCKFVGLEVPARWFVRRKDRLAAESS